MYRKVWDIARLTGNSQQAGCSVNILVSTGIDSAILSDFLNKACILMQTLDDRWRYDDTVGGCRCMPWNNQGTDYPFGEAA
jgi:hypothetical protein